MKKRAAALVLALVFALQLSMSIADPIRRLTQTMRRVEDGDLHVRSQVSSRTELGQLSDSFDHMIAKTAELMDNVSKLYEELISFSDLYDSASFEAKKMIVNQLIRRVDVYRGYQLNITFNFDLTPYIEGDDAAAC